MEAEQDATRPNGDKVHEIGNASRNTGGNQNHKNHRGQNEIQNMIPYTFKEENKDISSKDEDFTNDNTSTTDLDAKNFQLKAMQRILKKEESKG